MQTFKKFLTEKHTKHSALESIISRPGKPPVIFTPSMMRRIKYIYEDVTAFHITDFEGLENLSSLEGSTKQVSVLFNVANITALKDAVGGIETAGGYVCELTGDVTGHLSMDMFTGVVEGGRRSILLGPGKFLYQLQSQYENTPKEKEINTLFNNLTSELSDYQDEIIDNLSQEIIKNRDPRLEKAKVEYDIMSRVARDRRSVKETNFYNLVQIAKNNGTIDSRMLQKIVADYMDKVEKTLERNPEYKQLFIDDFSEGPLHFDEGIMSNIQIEKVHVFSLDEVAKFERSGIEKLFKEKGYEGDELDEKTYERLYNDMKKRIRNVTGVDTEVWSDNNERASAESKNAFIKYMRKKLRTTRQKLGLQDY